MFKLDPIKVTCKGFTAYFLINSGETCQNGLKRDNILKLRKQWVYYWLWLVFHIIHRDFLTGCQKLKLALQLNYSMLKKLGWCVKWTAKHHFIHCIAIFQLNIYFKKFMLLLENEICHEDTDYNSEYVLWLVERCEIFVRWYQ